VGIIFGIRGEVPRRKGLWQKGRNDEDYDDDDNNNNDK
jgi:hypothetical protein